MNIKTPQHIKNQLIELGYTPEQAEDLLTIVNKSSNRTIPLRTMNNAHSSR